jgi:hypothetical protein
VKLVTLYEPLADAGRSDEYATPPTRSRLRANEGARGGALGSSAWADGAIEKRNEKSAATPSDRCGDERIGRPYM